MTEKPVFIASDIHLGAAPPASEQAFLTWLASTAESAGLVVLNGDVFDFWFEYLWGTTRGHEGAFRVMREVIAAGVPVTMLGGNHDWWGGRFLREEVGVEFLQDPVVRELAGRRVFIGHGDGLAPGDDGYRIMRWVLRSRITRFAFSLLPPRVGDGVASRVSSTRKRWHGPTERDRRWGRLLSQWGTEKLQAEPELDLVVLGHTHQPELREVGEGRWYVNLGDWVFYHTYLILERGAPPGLLDYTAKPDS